MLPRAHRLNLSADLRRVMRRGRRFSISSAVIFTLSEKDQPARFGAIVPKVVGSAVVRHQVARKIRHSWLPLIGANAGVQLVVRAQAGADQLSVQDWTAACREAIERQAR